MLGLSNPRDRFIFTYQKLLQMVLAQEGLPILLENQKHLFYTWQS